MMRDGRNSVKEVPSNLGGFIASAIGFLIAAVLGSCVFATRVFPQDAPNWNGLSIGVSADYTQGEQTTSLALPEYGLGAELYKLSYSGSMSGGTAVLLWQIPNSPFILGAEGTYRKGSVRGSTSWTYDEYTIGVRYSQTAAAELSIRGGVLLTPNDALFATAGLVGKEMSLCVFGNSPSFQVMGCHDGWGMDMFVPGLSFEHRGPNRGRGRLSLSYDVGISFPEFGMKESVDIWGKTLVGEVNADEWILKGGLKLVF